MDKRKFLLCSMMAYIFVLKFLGYYASTLLFLLLTLYCYQESRIKVIKSSLIFIVLLYVLMNGFLNINLPNGFII